jgi:ABC-type spermidine/putrescine transport system permease subunit I
MKRLGTLLLAAPAVLLLVLFLAGPLLLVLRVSICEEAGGAGFYRPGTWSLASYHSLLSDSYFRAVWWFTLLLGLGVATLTLLLAYPLALFLRGLPTRAKALGLAAVVLPKLASVLVVVYGLKVLLGGNGPISGLLLLLGAAHEPLALYPNLAGVVIGEVYLLLPYAVLVLVAGLERIDPELEAAARGLGASPWTVFRRVTLPLSLPAAAVATQLCLVWALGALLGPLLLGSPEETTLAQEVQELTVKRSNWPRGAAVAVVMLVTLATCLALTLLPRRRASGGTSS